MKLLTAIRYIQKRQSQDLNKARPTVVNHNMVLLPGALELEPAGDGATGGTGTTGGTPDGLLAGFGAAVTF